jgi:hypothetical protein
MSLYYVMLNRWIVNPSPSFCHNCPYADMGYATHFLTENSYTVEDRYSWWGCNTVVGKFT